MLKINYVEEILSQACLWVGAPQYWGAVTSVRMGGGSSVKHWGGWFIQTCSTSTMQQQGLSAFVTADLFSPSLMVFCPLLTVRRKHTTGPGRGPDPRGPGRGLDHKGVQRTGTGTGPQRFSSTRHLFAVFIYSFFKGYKSSKV